MEERRKKVRVNFNKTGTVRKFELIYLEFKLEQFGSNMFVVFQIVRPSLIGKYDLLLCC